MSQRLTKLYNFLAERNLDGIIINKPENVTYFSGFTGDSGFLLINRDQKKLFTDFRYIEQAEKQAPEYDIVRIGAQPYEIVKATIHELGLKYIGFESDFVVYDLYSKLNAFDNIDFMPQQLDTLRMIKDAVELDRIRKAVDIADQAFIHILSVIKPGVSEQEIAAELEYHMRKLGSEKAAFDTIVASGTRGALPHGIASAKKIETGDMVTMDYGAVYKGYHSDITRTVVVGKANARQKNIYQTVLTAQLTGVHKVKPGIHAAEVDSAARDIIGEAGYKEYFGHGLGHGVGLAIHEEPRLSPASTNVLLTENMVVTVEPGIYLPGWGGIRIEDTVVVAADGAQVLTSSSKELIEIN